MAVHKAKVRHTLPAATAAVAENTAAEPVQAAPSQAVEATPAPLLAQNDTDVTQRYASREQASKDQQQFRGGDAIVISAGALVVVLLIVILILLLR